MGDELSSTCVYESVILTVCLCVGLSLWLVLHRYGYVTPTDVPILLDDHINKGQIIHRLWRGKMGTDEEQANP